MSEKPDALAVPVEVMMRRPTLFGVPALPIPAAPVLIRRAHVQEGGALAALLGCEFAAERWGCAMKLAPNPSFKRTPNGVA